MDFNHLVMESQLERIFSSLGSWHCIHLQAQVRGLGSQQDRLLYGTTLGYISGVFKLDTA